MNYFLAFVSVENIDLKRISIKNLIFNEFKQTAMEVKGEKRISSLFMPVIKILK